MSSKTDWLEFVKEYRQKNPSYSYKEALIKCKVLRKAIEHLKEEGYKQIKIVDNTKPLPKKIKNLGPNLVVHVPKD